MRVRSKMKHCMALLGQWIFLWWKNNKKDEREREETKKEKAFGK